MWRQKWPLNYVNNLYRSFLQISNKERCLKTLFRYLISLFTMHFDICCTKKNSALREGTQKCCSIASNVCMYVGKLWCYRLPSKRAWKNRWTFFRGDLSLRFGLNWIFQFVFKQKQDETWLIIWMKHMLIQWISQI